MNNPSVQRRFPFEYLITAILFLIYYLSVLSIHWNFESGPMDFNIYLRRIWSLGHFRLLPDVFAGNIHPWVDHFEPLLFLVGWLGRLPRPDLWLLGFESLCVAVAFLPLYWLAKDILDDRFSAVFVALTFSLSLGTFQAINRPIHPGTWAPTFYAFAFLFAYRAQYVRYCLAFILVCLLRENSAFHLVSMGCFFFVVWKRRCVGALTILFASVYLVTVTHIVMPNFLPFSTGSWWRGYTHPAVYAPFDGPLGVVRFILFHPIDALMFAFNNSTKQLSVYLSFATSGFLALFSVASPWLVLPLFVEKLFASKPNVQGMGFYYSIPLMMMVTISGLVFIRTVRNRFTDLRLLRSLSVLMAVSSLSLMLFSKTYPSPIWRLGKRGTPPVFTAARSSLVKLQLSIPPNASLVSLGSLLPHLVPREKSGIMGIHPLPHFQYVLLPKSKWIPSPLVGPEKVKFEIERLRRDPQYLVEKEDGSFVLFRKRS